MAIGFVLVTLAPGQEVAACDAIVRVSGIVEAMPLFGEYDLLVKVEADDWEALGRIIIDGIRQVPGVVATKTLTATSL